jgi:hypothetical protein
MYIKIDKDDRGCCSAYCDFRNTDYCELFKENLHGAVPTPTRCGRCHSLASEDKGIGEVESIILKKYLSDNLRIDIASFQDFDGVGLVVKLELEGEVISKDKVYFE